MSAGGPQSDAPNPPGFAERWLEAQHALGGYVCVHVQDQSLADDIVQEVARQATANFDQYDPSRPFIAWLIGIARQRIAENYRMQGRRPVVFSSDIVESITDAYVDLQPEVDDRLDALRHCMDQLSNRHRRVIELRYARQLSQEQIGTQVGTNGRAINAMLFRIRTALRECVSNKMEQTR
ncbi:MAG: sigma-70 family RNA polymerase sigma factor [Phycisphaeraceae bacterium]|nr:sigma-70 family RNA polymerase sigma factor [Phycisphaeraceae bacterium]